MASGWDDLLARFGQSAADVTRWWEDRLPGAAPPIPSLPDGGDIWSTIPELPDRGGDPGFLRSLPDLSVWDGDPGFYRFGASPPLDTSFLSSFSAPAAPLSLYNPQYLSATSAPSPFGRDVWQGGALKQPKAQPGTTGPAGERGPKTGMPGGGAQMSADPDPVMRWEPIAREMAEKYDVPVAAVLALIQNESGGQPGAKSKENSGGQGRAVGLMQLIPMYHATDGADLTDPRTNIERGTRYFAQGYHAHGNRLDAGMANYFGGGGAFDAQGNIRRDRSDGNITIGDYIDQRFLPSVRAWEQRLATRPTAASAPPSGGRSDLWAWTGGARFPITGLFGAKDGPYPGTGHRGIDIGTPSNTRLVSPIDGVVLAAGDVGGGYGNQVRIATPYGSVLLGHLGSVGVQVGQRVGQGTYLGMTGSTGKSTGPHLHLELRDARDNPLDPAGYYGW